MASLESLGLLDALLLGPGAEGSTPVTGLSVDSRQTRPGHVFAALHGTKFDGADFVPYAIRMGAVAVLTSLDGALKARDACGGDWPVPMIVVDDPRRSLALTAARFFARQPRAQVAVTGTNGKTSVASFCRQLWTALGERAVNLGTTGVEGAVETPLSHTTPDPIELHGLLAQLEQQGVTHAAMEASSHGLAQRRVDGVTLVAGALTHISRDHLDYHRDAADYAAAKLGLFSRVLPSGATAVVNTDDVNFQPAADIARARGLKLLRVGEAACADIRLLDIRYTDHGQEVRFAHKGTERTVALPLIGGFQAHNALVAAGLVISAGAAPEAVFDALPSLRGVRGRMELVATRANGASVFVDYAHTPGSVEAALAALRLHTPGRLVVVLGAGGDRDAGKRPLMGEAAAKGADHVIVTDDNPRSEDPAAIRAAVMAGAPEAENVGDRAEAILRGVDSLGPQDRLLVAGKGHETGQTISGTVHPFDDADVARAAVVALDGEEKT